LLVSQDGQRRLSPSLGRYGVAAKCARSSSLRSPASRLDHSWIHRRGGRLRRGRFAGDLHEGRPSLRPAAGIVACNGLLASRACERGSAGATEDHRLSIWCEDQAGATSVRWRSRDRRARGWEA
jgi:hypothetical protein